MNLVHCADSLDQIYQANNRFIFRQKHFDPVWF